MGDAFKVVLLGEGRVGKTCLCLRYVQNSFSSSQESTIQASYLDKRLNVAKRSVKLMIWDTAGQERFHALGPIYYRDAQGALLVYDITDEPSFKKVRHWVKELREIVGKDIQIVIAGNKCDLQKEKKVSDEEAKEYAASVGATWTTCSAKSGKGVENAFLELTKGMLRQQKKREGRGPGIETGDRKTGGGKRTYIQITQEMENDNNGGCCG